MCIRDSNKSKGEIMKTNYVYIVKCQDNTFYTGWTTDLVKRINAHNHGKGAKYTKARRPVEMCIRDSQYPSYITSFYLFHQDPSYK